MEHTLNNAKAQGYLDAAERGTFRINTVGENLVAMTFTGNIGCHCEGACKETQGSKKTKEESCGARRTLGCRSNDQCSGVLGVAAR